MRVSITKAPAQLAELVRRVEAGEDVVLTRHGHAAVRLVPVHMFHPSKIAGFFSKRFESPVQRRCRRASPAARSQDFLYEDETGLPCRIFSDAINSI